MQTLPLSATAAVTAQTGLRPHHRRWRAGMAMIMGLGMMILLASPIAASAAEPPAPPRIEYLSTSSEGAYLQNFTVGLRGRSPMTIQWQRNGYAIDSPRVGAAHPLSDLVTDRLQVPSSYAYSGDYRVVATNADGTFTSQALTFSAIQDYPFVSTQPESTTAFIAPGTSVAVRVVVQGRPPFTYQWQKNDVNFGPPRQSDSTRDDLVLPAAAGSAGSYRCIITSPYGWTVSDEAKVILWPAGSLRQIYPAVLARKGGALHLQAVLDGAPNEDSGYLVHGARWHHGARSWPSDGSFLFPRGFDRYPLTLQDGGTYRATLGYHGRTLTSDPAQVAVVDADARTVEGQAGGSISLTVRVAGGKGLHFQWVRERRLLPADRTSGASTQTLTLTRLDPASDPGTYNCVIRMDGVPRALVTDGITLNVDNTAPYIEPGAVLPGGSMLRPYRFEIPVVSSGPVTITATGLPPGLACDPVPGVLTGTPVRAGTYAVKFTIHNAWHTTVTTLPLVIAPLERELAGTWAGPVGAGSTSTLRLVVAESGAFTGRLVLWRYPGVLQSIPFSGRLSAGDQVASLCTGRSGPFHVRPFRILPGGRAHVTVSWRADHILEASWTLDDERDGGYSNPLHQGFNRHTRPATEYTGYYAASIVREGFLATASSGRSAGPDTNGATASDGPQIAPDAPRGSAAFTLNLDGAGTIAGRLPDGTAYATPTFITEEGQAWAQGWLYGYRGLIQFRHSISRPAPPGLPVVAGYARWYTPLPPEQGLVEPSVVVVTGGLYLPPSSPLALSPYLLGVQPSAGSAVADIAVRIDGQHIIPATINAKQAVAVQSPASGVPFTLGELRFNAATGAFAGRGAGTFPDPRTGVTRRQTLVLRGIIDSPAHASGYYAVLINGAERSVGHVEVVPR